MKKRLSETDIDAIARHIVAMESQKNRRVFIAGNWKMHTTPDEAASLVSQLVPKLEGFRGQVMVAPPAPCLDRVAGIVRGTPVLLGAQHVHWADQGAYTGEISCPMLRALGVSHVILGHSERRQHFHETDSDVNRRMAAVLSSGMVPIVCVGEHLEHRQGDYAAVIRQQLEGCFAGFDAHKLMNVMVAYEPVWAIGTGQVATPEQAQEVHAMIRSFLARRFGSAMAESTRILYGGSVKPENAAALVSRQDVDGALVGGASLNAESLAGICTVAGSDVPR